MARKIAVFTGTRADWGLLSPVARALNEHPEAQVVVAATNMHLSQRCGNTLSEVVADGFDPVIIPMNPDAAEESPQARVAEMARCMEATAQWLAAEQPHLALILGDRYEMLAIASACLMSGVPIAHIAGGETSLGAVDDSIRHAITQMSSIHLTATEPYRQRVIAMGKEPERVVNTGAIGLYNLANIEHPASAQEIEEFTGVRPDRNTILFTYHPATIDSASPAERAAQVVEALEILTSRHGVKVIITAPNNDAGGLEVNNALRRFADTHAGTGRVGMVASLGRRRYLSTLLLVGAVVGNSSSGIVEVPSAGIPTVNIGCRQKGRIAAESVIHCGDSPSEIVAATLRALGPNRPKPAQNPYFKPDTLALMVDALTNIPLQP